MNRFFFLFFLAALASCAHSNKSQNTHQAPTQMKNAPVSSANGIAWRHSDKLAPVLEEAQKLKKPVFLEFYATWCGPCKVMEREVFSKPEVYNYLNANFINYHVDVDSPNGRTISEIYEIKGMPTVVFVDPKGVVIERELGLITTNRFKQVAEAALAKMK
ncbi:MAG: thioredoxin family protein [Bacteroidetes bacterium]|nr:thioredoxin family protein [Bacteroidota bacterium]